MKNVTAPEGEVGAVRWWYLVFLGPCCFVWAGIAALVSLFTPMDVLFGTVAFLLYAPVGALAIVGLYMDTDEIRVSGCGWHPRPFRYVIGGALLPFAVLAPELLAGVESAAALNARFVVTGMASLLLSAALFAPVYLWRRHRHLGVP